MAASIARELKRAPGTFENLVVRWAMVEFGDRFRTVNTRGRRPDDVPVNKWPDGYVELADGSLDVLEVSMREDFLGYVRESRGSFAKRPVSACVLVTWAVSPTWSSVDEARKLLADAGVPRDRIEFVFRDRLVRQLTLPRYAHLWHMVGVSASALPFRLVDPQKGLVGLEGGGRALHPLPGEFLAGQVHRPAVLGLVSQRLSDERSAEVRGRGAAGKTVLAEHLIQDHVAGRPGGAAGEAMRPAFYLRLGERLSDGGARAVEALVSRDDENVLFVVDDIHLDEILARDLQEAWSESGNGSRLLLLGRQRSWPRAGEAAEAAESGSALTLGVSREELRGVYRRVALREAGVTEPPDPPPAILSEWLALFRGDLVVFGAAVSQRIKRLVREEWALTAHDAPDRVRERYLDDEQENPDLLRLAFLASIEVPVPSSIAGGLVPKAVNKGVVIHRAGPRGTNDLRLAHAGLGQLLLAATMPPADWKLLDVWTDADVSLALVVAQRRLAYAAEYAERLLRTAWGCSNDEFVAGLMHLGPVQIESTLDVLQFFEIVTAEAIDERLADVANEVLARLLDDPGETRGLLALLRARAPRTYAAVAALLPEETAVRTLGRYLIEAPSNSRAALLNVAVDLPDTGRALARHLSIRDNLRPLFSDGERALQLLGSSAFRRLCWFEPALGEAVEEALTEDRAVIDAIADATVASRPDAVARSTAASAPWPNVIEAIEQRLADAEVRRAIAARADQITETELVNVLNFAADRGDLQQLIDEQVRWHSERIVVALARDTGLMARYRDHGHRLLAELADQAERLRQSTPGAYDADRSPEAQELRRRREIIDNPRAALMVRLPFVLAVIAEPSTPAAGAAALIGVLGDPANRETVIASALTLTPEHFAQVLRFVRDEVPDLLEGLRAQLGTEAGITRLAEMSVGSTFDHIAGLLSTLDEAAPEIAAELERRLAAPPWLSQLLFAGQVSHPSGWTALLDRTSLASALLEHVDARWWRYRWRTAPPEEPHWVRSLAIHLNAREELQAAPAEHVVLTSRREDWASGGFGLAQLDSVLRHSQGLGEQAAIQFIERALGPSWLDEQFRTQKASSISLLVMRAWRWRGDAVVAALLSKGFARRVAVEGRRGWDGSTPADVAGVLMLAGVASLVGVRWRGAPIGGRLAEAVLHDSYVLRSELTGHQFALSLGLRTVVTDGGQPLRLTNRPTLRHHLELWKAATPQDVRTQRVNAWMREWIEDAEQRRWVFQPDRRPVEETIRVALAE
jgi:hypothetical protein